MTENDIRKQVKGWLVLGLIWLLGAICDRIWFVLDHSVPAWDQADYLTGSLNYWKALQNADLFNGNWWPGFWQLSSKIPPLTYIITGFFHNYFGAGFDQSTFVNLFFSGILLASIYALGVELFSIEVGLLAAALCQLLPGLYRFRLDFLLDYPLTAIVTLCFYYLTVWYKFRNAKTRITRREQWGKAVRFGITFGFALLTKQTAIFFLLIPLLWVSVGEIRNLIKNIKLKIKQESNSLGHSINRIVQLITALLLSVLVFGPWYRTNWLFILTSGKRATVDSAIAEGDPALNTLGAWTFYWQDLPYVVSWPLLIIPIVGLTIYFGRLLLKKVQENKPFPIIPHQASLKWIAIFWVSSYLLSSLNINKDTRYVMPYLPILCLFLAYGLTLWNGRIGKNIRWGTIGLGILLMLLNIYPLPGAWLAQFLSPRFQHYAYMGAELPHEKVIAEITKTEPYLRSNLGVLPSTPEINQHNLNYYGALQNFQVYGRQVGTRKKFLQQDARSLSWFVTKTDNQGSVPSEAQAAIVEIVEKNGDFRLQKTWKLPDGSNLNLYHRKTSPVIVKPLKKSHRKIRLNQVIVPSKVPPGSPVPVTYKWSGYWPALQSGLVLLNWRNTSVKNEQITNQYRWLHDHAIGMGNLYLGKPNSLDQYFQVIEQTAMLPPANIVPGIYTLEATYLNRQTGKTYPIQVPEVKLIIDPNAAPIPAPELDLVTQFRTLAAGLPQGLKGLTPIFDQTGRINQYDPTQDYVVQAGRTLNYRLQQEPKNVEFAYAFALTKVLRRKVNDSIEALETVTQLDPKNPYVYAYLAFVHLYDWHPKAAEKVLNSALTLNPNIPELKAMSGVAALMQGKLIKAWYNLEPLIAKK